MSTTTCSINSATKSSSSSSPAAAAGVGNYIRFHNGELLAQSKGGTHGVAVELSESFSSSLHYERGHDIFLKQQKFAIITSVCPPSTRTTTTTAPEEKQEEEEAEEGEGEGDQDGSRRGRHGRGRTTRDVWVTPIFGRPGFISTNDEHTIVIKKNAIPVNDILFKNSTMNQTPLSLLGIDLMKRIRHRINGRAIKIISKDNNDDENDGNEEEEERKKEDLTFQMEVLEYSPNCPKYINRRDIITTTNDDDDDDTSSTVINQDAIRTESTSLSDDDMNMISRMDTLFIGSYYEKQGADLNHRGGRPGFIRILSKTEIVWPEYRGNGTFFTTGNLEMNTAAGVTMIDFDNTGDILQMTGNAVVDWNAAGEFDGATRTMHFHINKVVRVHNATKYRWKLYEYSPYNPIPGGAGGGNDITTNNNSYPVEVTLAKIVIESPIVKTFRWLAPRSIPFLPGQYATFEFDHKLIYDHDDNNNNNNNDSSRSGNAKENPIRTWTLSETANSILGDNTLDVSVKKKEGGLISTWLHEKAQIGMKVQLHGVDGVMTPIMFDKVDVEEEEQEDESSTTMRKPSVVSKHLLLISAGIGITPNVAIVRGLGAFEVQDVTNIIMIHQERYKEYLPFQSELQRRCKNYQSFQIYNVISSSQDGQRLNQEKLETLLYGVDMYQQTVYLCGPTSFMSDITKYLVHMGTNPSNIHTENFDF